MRVELGNDDGFMRASSRDCGERSDAISDQGNLAAAEMRWTTKQQGLDARCISKHRAGATCKAASLENEVVNRDRKVYPSCFRN